MHSFYNIQLLVIFYSIDTLLVNSSVI